MVGLRLVLLLHDYFCCCFIAVSYNFYYYFSRTLRDVTVVGVGENVVHFKSAKIQRSV